MRDYKNRLIRHSNSDRDMYLPAPSGFQGSGLIYIFIFFILILSFFYVYGQIRKGDTTFSEIYSIVMSKYGNTEEEEIVESFSEGTEIVESSGDDRLMEIMKNNGIILQDENEVDFGLETTELQVSSHLFLIEIPEVSSGSIYFKPIEKNIQTTQDGYFGDLIEQLIKAKSNDPDKLNVFNTEVRVLSTYIESGVLMLDFNDAFEYSKYGSVGIHAQIQQILWTIFSNRRDYKVDAVGILINGQRKEFIGGEGYSLKLFYSSKDLKREVQIHG